MSRPLVFVLTDGSGRSGKSRLDSTRALLDRTGAAAGEVFGAFTDRQLYEALLKGEPSAFLDVTERLADAFVRRGIETVVADPAEGYNPAHDVCRLITDTAVRAATARGCSIGSWEFPLVRPATEDPEGTRRIVLDDAALERKRAAAESYPEMRAEVDAALGRAGLESYRVAREKYRFTDAGVGGSSQHSSPAPRRSPRWLRARFLPCGPSRRSARPRARRI